ncbi:MAG: hypothetical protein A2063_01270 [Gallionellales bacterium GWA2_60_142]|nr:MAG: hypothetical protein A2063_01270 [Gallionellales bacterium GWA2_60_142]HCI13924.1 hypothetical protein [Gallionellaceae bacterium]
MTVGDNPTFHTLLLPGDQTIAHFLSAVRPPLLNPLDETTSHSTRLQKTATKSLVIPQAGEDAMVPPLPGTDESLSFRGSYFAR